MKGKNETLLIVEDEAHIRKFLRISLEAHGYQVREARLGEEGLHICVTTPPRLVILDLGLPDLDGLDLDPLDRLLGQQGIQEHDLLGKGPLRMPDLFRVLLGEFQAAFYSLRIGPAAVDFQEI